MTEPVTGSAANPAPQNAVKTALLLLAAVTLFRLWYISHFGLVADEAYYWLWSKHLAASYTDKGPVIAWLIAAGTWIFGDTLFGVRWLGVLLSAGIGWQIFCLARRLYDERTALWCLVVASVIPMFSLGSVIMTIDTPSVFCWAWAANVFLTALESGKIRHWFGLGLVIGLGFLAKFTNGVQLICLGLFLMWSRSHRHFLFSRQSLATAIAFGLSSLPILWWNWSVGWLQVAALHSRSGVKHDFEIHPGQLFQFLGTEIGVLSPLMGVGMAVAGFVLWFRSRREMRVQFLLCQFLPLYALFSFFSLNSAGKANWPVPALIGGIVLLVAFWRDLAQRRPAWRWANYAALGMAALMTLGLHVATFTYLPLVQKLINRSQGWPDYAAHLVRDRERYHADLLIGDHYSTVSLAEFYLPDHPRVYQPTGWHPQFELWGDYRLHPGERALFITTDNKRTPEQKLPLSKEFARSQLIDDFWTRAQGRNIKRFHVYLLTAGGNCTNSVAAVHFTQK